MPSLPCACSSCSARLTKFKTVNMREEGPGAGQHREDGDRAMNVLMKCQETPHFTLEAGNWNVIISQSSETITHDHHHRAGSEGNVGAPAQLERYFVTKYISATLATFPVILSKLAEARAILLTFVFFLLCLSFYSFTKPFSLTQKTGQF